MYDIDPMHLLKTLIIAGKHNELQLGQFQNHAGGRLNKKDGLTRYGNSHVKDKTS